MQIFLIIALIIAIIAVIFAVQNTIMVTLAFLAWHITQPLAVVLLITLAAGALISIFLSLPSNVRTRWGLRQQKKRLTDLDTQLQEAQNRLNDLDTQIKDKDAQLIKLQDELLALKTSSQPALETAPSDTAALAPEPAEIEPVARTKTIASFFKSFTGRGSLTTTAPEPPTYVEPAASPATVAPPVVEPPVIETPAAVSSASDTPTGEQSASEPPEAETSETADTEEDPSA